MSIKKPITYLLFLFLNIYLWFKLGGSCDKMAQIVFMVKANLIKCNLM